MATETATIHEVRRGKVKGDGSCLYTSFRYVNGTSNSIDNKRLRSMVADYIRRQKDLHSAVLASGTNCKTVEEYCVKIEKYNLWGGEPEIRALAKIGHVLIRLVSVTKTAQGMYFTNILNYGEDVESFKDCVYILYDEENKHYDPLYMINKKILDEKLTIFERSDEKVLELVLKFIREEFHDEAFIQLECDGPSYEVELPTGAHIINEIEQMFSLIAPMASTNLSKRKSPDHANLTFAKITEKALPSSISDNNEVYDKPTKLAKLDTDKTSVDDENNCLSMSVEQYLQTDFSMVSNQMPEMKFEVEPALGFRGRTSGDFKPLRAKKFNGKPSTARRPRYFADRDNHHYLNLLIPETHLSTGLRTCFETCIVTREINGYTYFHPYFQFQTHPTDRQAPNLNPIYRFVDPTTDLKACVNMLFQQLELKLVVVMLKNNELMLAHQPLTVFLAPKNNDSGPAITTKYDSPDTFKDAYHLHDLRFAVTLWQKPLGEKIFRRCDDIQYISQISTEDQRYKVQKK